MARSEANNDLPYAARLVLVVGYFDTTFSDSQVGPILHGFSVLWLIPHRQSVSAVSTVGFTNEMAILESPY